MTSALAATLAASSEHIVAGVDETVLLRQVLHHRQLLARMLETTQGYVSLQHVLDCATLAAAQGCGAPMAKVLELDPADNTLVLKRQYGLSPHTLGCDVGKAEPGNPPGDALRQVAPVVVSDVRQRPPALLPTIFIDYNVVTSINLPLVNIDGAFGILEVDFTRQTEVESLHLSFLASVAGALAGNIEKVREKVRARAALTLERDAKAVLLKEQQHRIRNNFQLIIAMVQRSSLASHDEAGSKSLRDIERRVLAMASLYDHLLGLSEQAECADLGRYLSAMAANFDDFYDLRRSDISLKIDLEFGIVADLDTCTTVGTVVNELVANAVEHAFGDGRGQITVSLTRPPSGDCLVCVTDNGQSLSTMALVENTGLRTVRNMLTGLGGKLELGVGPEGGLKWSLMFRDAPHGRRPHRSIL
jgi:two-component sensor histidine kinase